MYLSRAWVDAIGLRSLYMHSFFCSPFSSAKCKPQGNSIEHLPGGNKYWSLCTVPSAIATESESESDGRVCPAPDGPE